MRFLWSVQGEQCLCQVPGTLQGGGVLVGVEGYCGAGVVLGAGPFLELDAGDGAVGEECWFIGVLLDTVVDVTVSLFFPPRSLPCAGR